MPPHRRRLPRSGAQSADPTRSSGQLQLIPGLTHQAQGPHDRAPMRHCPILPPVGIETLREEFPVFERIAYLNAGTDGPLPAAAAQAGAEELLGEARRGRAGEHFERRHELAESCAQPTPGRSAASPSEVALTTCTSEGLSSVIDGLGLARAMRSSPATRSTRVCSARSAPRVTLRGVSIRAVPFADIAEAVGPRTRLVACSHVSWMSGRVSRPPRSPNWTCPSCSTAPRAWERCRWTCARWAATPTPAPGRSGCAARTASACSMWRPRCASA